MERSASVQMNINIKTRFLTVCHRYWLLCLLLIIAVYGSASSGYAQNYYPDEFGNMWFLRSTDGIDERVITIQGPQIINGESLKIIVERTNDNINQFFIKSESDGVKLFRAVTSVPVFGNVTFDYSPPQTFLPSPIGLGSEWKVVSEGGLPLGIKVQLTNHAKIVVIEDVTVPAGTFRNCLKIQQDIQIRVPGITDLSPQSNVMWLAPDIGLVKTITTNDITFELIRFDVTIDGTVVAVEPKDKLATTWAALKKK
jgi:hypothetical protein